MADKGATGRVGITFHVTPAQADMLDARALTLGVTRAELARSRVLGEPDKDDAEPLLAALASAVRLLHHLEGQSLNEPPRDCRRPSGLNYAAIGVSSSMA